jgi:hypothetical protein
LSHFDACVADAALACKRTHPRWGAARILLELQRQPSLQALRLPKGSRLEAFFKRHCPECMRTPQPKRRRSPLRPQAVHEHWQLDSQEGIRLGNGELTTICNLRDPVGAAMLASQVFVVQTARHWRKLDWTEVRGVLRQGFTEWQTLPGSVQTDNELGLAGSPTDALPSRLTLWRVGLGVAHTFIRPGQPRDQPEIERQHCTLDGFALDADSLQNPVALQQRLDRERHLYNEAHPTRASDCAQRAPLVAPPELRRPRRPYAPQNEVQLFDLQRVYDYVATIAFERKANARRQASLGSRLHTIRGAHRGHAVRLRLYAQRHEWVCCSASEVELKRFAPQGLDVPTLTGLAPTHRQDPPPIQPTLPFFISHRVRFYWIVKGTTLQELTHICLRTGCSKLRMQRGADGNKVDGGYFNGVIVGGI